MKLNYKRTIFVGLAFFLICAFWQAYDTIIPKILVDKFGMSQANSGIVMALDNVLAIALLPLFGVLSDRTKTKLGRRTPYILIGTLVAVVAFVGLSLVDNAQKANLKTAQQVESVLFDSDYDGLKRQDSMTAGEGIDLVLESVSGKELINTDGIHFIVDPASAPENAIKLSDYVKTAKNDLDPNAVVVVDRSEFTDIRQYFSEDGKSPGKLYTDIYVPARQVYAQGVRAGHPGTLIAFIVVLLVVLLAMCTFRSPAVALMPDVTLKPLRSKANAVINLMGSAGGILVLGLGIFFKTGSVKNSLMSYTAFFAVIAGVMLLALIVFLITVREPKFVDEAEEARKRFGIEEDTGDENGGGRKLSPGERRSFILLLLSVALWFMGYNAVTSKYSVYANKVLDLDYNLTLMIAQGAAIISYIPVGLIASKVGRKKTILAGVLMLAGSFLVACFLRKGSSALLMNCMFALAGIGWATINVNSFPMVVELCKGGNVGKFTGYYYTASMAAQVLTPYLSGLLMDKTGMTSLFPYAVVFVGLSFVTMLFVMHGDSKPQKKSGLEAIGEADTD
ncbi:MAG: MFS transporter [Clostridia bacterium]|nr:MFS transporter [Clostridia bacterium]MBQ2191959.1 MFS transporter [Clostridia bacterium]